VYTLTFVTFMVITGIYILYVVISTTEWAV